MRLLHAARKSLGTAPVLKRLLLHSRITSANAYCPVTLAPTPSNEATSISLFFTTARHANEASTVASQQHDAPAGAAEQQFEFQAETRSLLGIVAKSLYSDQEVFIRELISNASDALEKRRCMELSTEEGAAPPSSTPYELRITTNADERTLTFHDTGVGMSRQELIDLLGTIAKSGSKEFASDKAKGRDGADAAVDTIIGQFGVGFYSTFIVADEVVVRTKRVDSSHGFEWHWRDGQSTFSIRELKHWEMPAECGTEIRLHLKAGDAVERFNSEQKVEEVINKHSLFVQSPILLNGRRVNTAQALWMLKASETTAAQHEQFFQQLARSHHKHLVGDRPQYTFQYQTDSPINLRTLLYVPSHRVSHLEFSTQAQSGAHGVSLYCRKVLVKPHAKQLLPHYLRFLVGVVDSEDVPLNLSREMLQMDLVLEKIRRVLTDRVIAFFEKQLDKDRVQYSEFYSGYSLYFKEGIVTEPAQAVKEEIGKLLLFETSNFRAGTLTTLPEYVERMQEGQQQQATIYYIYAPSRQLAETSPYYTHFQTHNAGCEVLLLSDPSDELVFLAMPQFNGKRIESVEKWVKQKQEEEGKGSGEAKSQQELLRDPSKRELVQWIQQRLGSVKAHDVKPDFGKQADWDHPLMITVTGDMGAARHMLRIGEIKDIEHLVVLKPVVHVNFHHPIIKGLEKLRRDDEKLAKEIIEQVYDNALITAGLMKDSTRMVSRINHILSELITGADKSPILKP